ncbi:MAG: alpha/beta hydrolase [Pyrinomonadaceae bacterium]
MKFEFLLKGVIVILLGRFIRAREVKLSKVDVSRRVRPFEWGAEFIGEHINGDDPREIFRRHAREVFAKSDEFYALPEIEDYKLKENLLTWTSGIATHSVENNTARARFFPVGANESRRRASKKRSAIVVLPQWNALADSHVGLCRLLNRFGFAALRVTLPYHEERRPPEIERAVHLVSSNIGRTIQTMRQAVLDTRAAVRWLKEQGFERVGIVGTSIGSCAGFLSFAHDELIDVAVFNHVSGYFSDVVWEGISTQHVRAGIEKVLTLEELREFWSAVSPMPYIPRMVKLKQRPMRFIAARYDLTFPAHLSREVIAEVRRHNIPLDVTWLPCGHYTSAHRPFVYMDGWKIVSFFRKHL